MEECATMMYHYDDGDGITNHEKEGDDAERYDNDDVCISANVFRKIRFISSSENFLALKAIAHAFQCVSSRPL